MTRFVVVTGTSTEVGKTIATAALAVREAAAGRTVRVVKPLQTGVGPDEPGDADVVAQLAGVDAVDLVRLLEPLAPDTAARRAGVALPGVDELAALVVALGPGHDVVLVEGAGGLLVRADLDGGTFADLIAALRSRAGTAHAVEVVVVCAAGLGTLNHTALTVEALAARGLGVPAVVVGSWPAEPGLAERCNLADLPAVTGAPLAAVIPAGAGDLSPAAFRRAAPSWFDVPAPPEEAR